MEKGTKCAICGTNHYQKTMEYIDFYQRKGEEPKHHWDLPYKTNHICQKCASHVNIEVINNDSAYLAKEK